MIYIGSFKEYIVISHVTAINYPIRISMFPIRKESLWPMQQFLAINNQNNLMSKTSHTLRKNKGQIIYIAEHYYF